ncbi:MAG: ATP-binding protein [Magnetococcus sp. YQC-5]
MNDPNVLMSPPPSDYSFPRHRLGRRIVLYILLFSSLITLLATWLQLYIDFTHERTIVEQRLQEIEISHLPNIIQDIWMTRQDTVDLQLQGIADLPHIQYAKITLTNGDEIFRGKKGGDKIILRTFTLEWPFNNQVIPLGTLEIAATLDAIYAHLLDQVLVILATQAIKTFLVSFFILFLLHIMVGRRLNQMAEYAHMIQLKHLKELQPLSHRSVINGALNELDHLAMALNQMVSELRITYMQSQAFAHIIQKESDINLALQRISRMLITPDFQIHEVAHLLLECAQKLTHSEYGYVAEMDPIKGYVVISTLSDHLPSCHRETNAFFSSGDSERNYPGLRGYALNLGRGFFTNDPASHPAFLGNLPENHIPLRRFLSVPIMLNSRPMGQIVLTNAGMDYSAEDLDAIIRLGEVFAIALHQKMAHAEKQQIEMRLNHAQKLEAIGALASGVAHDFNNILAIIMGNAEYGQLANKGNPSLEELFNDMLQASLRGRDLVKQLLNFSRRTPTDFIFFQPQAVLKETLRLLRSTIPATVEIVSTIHTFTGSIYGDPVQFQQMLMNLCSNAVHAINGRANPVIEIHFEQVKVDQAAAVRLNVITGDYGCLTVSDNGCGIPESILKRIFDPFFTTKSVGVGTGLGLAMVHGYVHEAQGSIEVKNAVGAGTSFLVYLPLFPQIINDAERPRQNVLAGRQRGRIMVVDDEPQVVKVIGRMLELLGFAVEGYYDPGLALEHFRHNPSSFVALLTDRAMPEMNGVELGQQVHALNHEIPIFLCSGFIDHAMINTDIHPWLSGILKKPITIMELNKVLSLKLAKQANLTVT